MKVAFSTQDKQNVDAHFGWARHIVVYEVTAGGSTLVEAHDFTGELNEDGNEDKLAPKLAVIGDCSIMYCAAIGGSVGRSMDDVDRLKTSHTLESVRTGVPWKTIVLS